MKSSSKKNAWLTVENSTNPKDPTIIHIGGFIGDSYWDDSGKSAKQFSDELDKIPKGQPVTIKINSEGGVIKDGLGMYDAIKSRREDCTVQVVGYACSTASWLGLAAKNVRTADNAVWMIHESSQCTCGNKRDHTQSADCLETHDEAICGLISEKTGKSKKDVMTDLESEKWMTGKDAVEYGLADEGDDQPVDLARPVATNAAYMSRMPERFRKTVTANSISAPKQGAATANHKQNTIMEKSKIIAALTEGGIAVPENATDEQLLALLQNTVAKTKTSNSQTAPAAATTTTTAAQPANVVSLDAFNAEKRKRISGEVKRRGENKITNENLTWWIDLAMNDEERVFSQIDAMPTASNGGETVGRVVVVSENPLENIKKLKTASERRNAIRDDWNALFDDACSRDKRKGATPMNTNTYSGTLVTSFLIDGATTDLQNVWAPLMAFSIDYTTDPFKPLATGVLKHVISGATTQTNATNFESGDSNVGAVSVTMAQYTQSFQVSNSDLQNGLRMENLVTINTANFANKIIEVATTPITVANFGAAATASVIGTSSLVSSAAGFGFSELSLLQGALKKSSRKNLILDGSYIARVANTPGFFQAAGVVGGDTGAWKAFGWDIIAQNTDWNGAGPNVVGFACHPQAIAGITGMPITPPNIPGGILSQTSFSVPGIGVTVALFNWFNPSTRTMWTSYDIMGGFQAVDKTAGFMITSA